MNYLTDLAVIVISFLVDSKTSSNGNECANPKSLEIIFIRHKGFSYKF